MRTFFEKEAAHSQSIANDLEELKDSDFANIDYVRGKIDSIYKSMAAFNGSMQYFYEEHYKKNQKKRKIDKQQK